MSAKTVTHAVKWDYTQHPVQVTENLPPPRYDWDGAARTAFDGYGAQGSQPARTRGWMQPLRTDGTPYICEIDYGQPAAVSAYVHYFYVPGSRDLRYLATAPSAYKKVRISARTDEGADWAEIALLDDLPTACPQVLALPATRPARYWRIEVLELAAGAERLLSYCLETYTGGVPQIEPLPSWYPDLPAAFAARVCAQQPAQAPLPTTLELVPEGDKLVLSAGSAAQVTRGEVRFLLGGHKAVLAPAGQEGWRIALPEGYITVQPRATALGQLLTLRLVASSPVCPAYMAASVELALPQADLYYMPAYVWSHAPVEKLVNACNVQTRMASLGLADCVFSLIPGTDRGRLGYAAGAAHSDLVLSNTPTTLLLSVTPGDWWDAYRFAVCEVYGFAEQPQTVPVSEIQYGISRYLMSDEVWEPALGTLKSWPAHDPHTQLMGFDCFVLYGVPYSIPTYWARYVMNGDQRALERCRSIVHWLCTSAVRIQEGAARGAFYTLQRFGKGETPRPDKRGSTQGWGLETLTTQSTGAALWSLLYYRTVTGDNSSEVQRAVDEAVAWLLKTQTAEGGWPYGHQPNGQVVEGAPSSGCIWNIWALWRLGQQTGERRCLDAAERARLWYNRTFVQSHHYHGYWEDVGPGSREGYEAAIAAVAFGEMGDKELALATARDAIQWVFTRQIEPREPSCSAGLVAEQTGWPPASYCNPMMGLAAWTAWQLSCDPFWQPLAMIPKAVGWWYQPETGAMVWIVDATRMAPVVGPCFESWWTDWCIGQVGTLALRWLVREARRRTGGVLAVDEDTLRGRFGECEVQAWSPSGGLRPVLPQHGQVNWLGLRSPQSVLVALWNHGPAGQVHCPLDSRDVQGAALWPKAVHTFAGGQFRSSAWDGQTPAEVVPDGLVLFEWGLRA